MADALADLDEAGGIAAVSKVQGWRPGKVDKVKANLKAVQDQIDAGLTRLEADRRWG